VKTAAILKLNAPRGGRTSRAQARSLETRRQILSAAATLFREQGYKATTLRDIAKRLDMGAGSLYYHFGSKDEIIHEVLDLGISAIDRAVGAALDAAPDAPPLERLRIAIRAATGALIDAGDYTTAYVRIYNQLPRSVKRLDHPRRQAYMERWRRLVRVAQEDGAIKRDLPVDTFVEFLHGAISRLPDWYGPERGSGDELADLIGSWILDGVARG
jgi:TetR/AcrR family transcriptional regulator, cholesterol catabolism regulator